MSETLPAVYLARHGETPWTVTGQHTGRTDLPLTQRGERNAVRLGKRLSGLTFAKVFTSHCGAPCGHASWRASDPWLKSISISSSGTTVSTKAA
jgi:broad specificity phosphatase PhoE